MVKLKSKHWWEITEAFIERRRAGDKPVGTPDHVVTAMLEDLRALEAECERLRAMLPSAEVIAAIDRTQTIAEIYLPEYDGTELQVAANNAVHTTRRWLDSLESANAE